MLPINNRPTVALAQLNSNSSSTQDAPRERTWATDLHCKLKRVPKAAVECMPPSPITDLLLEGKPPQTQKDFELCVNYLGMSQEYHPVLDLLLQNTQFTELELYVLPHALPEQMLECLQHSSSLQRLSIGAYDPLQRPDFVQACPIQEIAMAAVAGEHAIPLRGQHCAALSAYLAENTTLKNLVVIGADIGARGADVLALGLAKNDTLQFLKIAHTRIGDQGATRLGTALSINRSLTVLSLAFAQIGEQGAIGLAKGLARNPKLESVTLSGNPIGDQGLAGIAQALNGRKVPLQLQLAGVGITITGVRALSCALGNPHYDLGGLILAGNALGDAAATVLCRALTECSIEWLDLSDNDIGAEGGGAVGKMLEHHPCLSELDLKNNPLAAGVAGIGRALKTNTVLETLDLLGCDIDAAGFAALGAGLKVNMKLCELCLTGNRGMQGGFAIFEAMALHPRLEILSLSSNGMPSACFEAAGKALAVNKKLRILELKSNHCGDEGALWLAKGLTANLHLQELELGKNDVQRFGAQSLFAALAGNQGLLSLNLATNLFDLDRGVLQALKALLAGNRTLEVLHLQGNPFASSMVVDQLIGSLRGNTVLLEFELGTFQREVGRLIEPVLRQNRLLREAPALANYLVGAAVGMMQSAKADFDGVGSVLGEFLFKQGDLPTLGSMARVNRRSRRSAQEAYLREAGKAAHQRASHT